MATRRRILNFDKYGQDPLSKDTLDKLLAIRNTLTLTITKREEANPQLISFEQYGTVELHWLILYYNGIGLSFDLLSGMEIQVPSSADVQQILASETRARPTNSPRTISI